MRSVDPRRVNAHLRWLTGILFVWGIWAYWLWARIQGPGTNPVIDTVVLVLILAGGRAVFGAADIGASLEAVNSLRDTVGELRGLLQDARELAEQQEQDDP